MTSTFFVASLIHVPLPGAGSVHLVLNGLMGIILGWACIPAILVALFLQAVLFQFGGLVVFGTNTFIMATPSLLCYLFFRPWLQHTGLKGKVASFSCGFISVLLSSIFMALALVASDKGFLKTSMVVVGTHFPMMIIEGFITMFTISFLAKVQPDFIDIK
jgi:cobalt/nickel transport system permease protein